MPIWSDVWYVIPGALRREYIPERYGTCLCEGTSLTRRAESRRRAINLRILSRYREGVHAISATMLISPRDNLYPPALHRHPGAARTITIGLRSAPDADVNHEMRRIEKTWLFSSRSRASPVKYWMKIHVRIRAHRTRPAYTWRVRLSRPPGRCYRSTKRTTAIAPTLLRQP